MKIAPPASEAERRALQARLEREHAKRVDVLSGLGHKFDDVSEWH